jgi:hypothetical protein
MHTTGKPKRGAANEGVGATDVAERRQPVFLLSPASLSGIRGRRVLGGVGTAPIAERLGRGEAVSIGEVYTSISSLYFRGKLAYARRYARVPHSVGVRIITSDRGLIAADAPVTLDDLSRMACVAIDEREPAYRRRLTESAVELVERLEDDSVVVLLGSLATRKYLDPLGDALGDRLRVPRDFIGLGDMSRGGLLLRAIAEGRELDYVPPPVHRGRSAERRSAQPGREGARRRRGGDVGG